jgi:hypothetical protein
VTALARESIEAGLDVAAATEQAALDPTITEFEGRIEWDAEGGMKFLGQEAYLPGSMM